jgi:hypothetical protein
MKSFLQFVLLTGVSLVAAPFGSEMEEYRVKALFLYNFTQFIEWPLESFKDSTDPLTICVLGPNPFDKELEHALAGKKVDSHPLISKIIGEASQASGCHVVFITSGATKRSRLLITERKQQGMLTVGEAPGFALGGGVVVNFLVKDGRVRLEINIGAAERERLRISAKLLKLAEIVK